MFEPDRKVIGGLENGVIVMADMTADVDGVEVKVNFSDQQMDLALASFGLAEPDEELVVHFFDRVEADTLALNRAGIILRLRQQDDGRGETTLKLRPAHEARLKGEWAAHSDHDGDYRIEYDWAASPVLSAGLDAKVGKAKGAAMVDGKLSAEEAFAGEQAAFLAECGEPPVPGLSNVSKAGPIHASRWKGIETGPFHGKSSLRAERWVYEGGPPFLEISFKAASPARAGELRAALLGELKRRGLEPDGPGQPKTEKVLGTLLGVQPSADEGV